MTPKAPSARPAGAPDRRVPPAPRTAHFAGARVDVAPASR